MCVPIEEIILSWGDKGIIVLFYSYFWRLERKERGMRKSANAKRTTMGAVQWGISPRYKNALLWFGRYLLVYFRNFLHYWPSSGLLPATSGLPKVPWLPLHKKTKSAKTLAHPYLSLLLSLRKQIGLWRTTNQRGWSATHCTNAWRSWTERWTCCHWRRWSKGSGSSTCAPGKVFSNWSPLTCPLVLAWNVGRWGFMQHSRWPFVSL